MRNCLAFHAPAASHPIRSPGWRYNRSMYAQARSRHPIVGIVVAMASVAVFTAATAPLQGHVGLLNEGLVLLLLVLLISSWWGWRVGLFAAVLSNLALNFFFVEPLHRFTVESPANVFGLAIFLLVSAVGGSLLASARAAAAEARVRAAETEVLLRLTRAMIGRTEPSDALASLCREVVEALSAPGAAVISGSGGQWFVHASAGTDGAARAPDSAERAMAERALATDAISRLGNTGLVGRGRRPRIVIPAGQSRAHHAAFGCAFVPLHIGNRTLGVLRVDGPIGDTPFRDQPDRLLVAFANEAAQGMQRAELAQTAAHADALMQADEMKSALMTSISHDLKTPLAGIKASVSSLLDTAVDWTAEDRRAFLETIDSQADRLNHVISDILDLNRIEAGAIAPQLRRVDVRTMLDDVRERTSYIAMDRDVRVETTPGLVVRADESLIVQALVNLVENAAKYSVTGGAITLKAGLHDGVVQIEVEDEGPGIAAADLPHVFERFYRAADQSRRVKGSGLGLAIVKGFVTLSGGRVRVESSPGGTRFVITLPEAAAMPVPATA